jgi:hypothetical protein
MKILSHRGYWKTAEEKNGLTAFRRSFALGFGTETDVRDMAGDLVIAHDMPVGTPLKLKEFLALINDPSMPLAINIKADGLAKHLAEHFSSRQLDWFVFDMSVPDMRSHLNVGNPVFVRMSEVELEPAWLNEAQGIWLDGFSTEWYDWQLIVSLLNRGKRICIVSPELHGRDPTALWDSLHGLSGNERLMLCTDHPEVAKSKFYGEMDK